MTVAREMLEDFGHGIDASRAHFFAGSAQTEALARLEHLVDANCRCGIVVGPRGTGKSTVLQVFAEECRAAGCVPLQIDVTGIGAVQLLERLAQRLEVTSRARGRLTVLWNEVTDALVGRTLAGRRCVLIIDHLDRAIPGCERIVRRLVTRVDGRQAETWIIGFSGRQFPLVPREWRERNDLRIELGPLDSRECHAFLQSLLAFFRCSPEAFGPAAETLVAASNGVPSDLRRLSDLSLLLADGPQASVSAEALEAAVRELRGLRYSA